MDWKSAYKPERKVEWEDIAAFIHETVTMDEVIAVYAPQLPIRNRRAPCPFHNGKDYNFSFTRYGYKCFVCGASGDVVAFVKDTLGCATRADAMKRMNADLRLRLPIDANITTEISEEVTRRRAEREARQAEEDAWWAEYHRVLDEWVRLDTIKRNADPNSEEYADAVLNIDFVGFQLDMLEVSKPSNT